VIAANVLCSKDMKLILGRTPNNQEGPVIRALFTLHSSRFYCLGLQLGQPALLTGCRIGVDQMLAARAIEELYRLGECCFDLGSGRGAHPLESAPKAAALGAVLRGTGATLAHALLGGFDSGHGNLG
jgi:hypothetical protein